MKLALKAWMIPALAAALALAAAPSRAVQVGVTVGGGEQFFDGERMLRDELAPFGALELRMTDRWGAEFWYLSASTDTAFEGELGLKTDIERWHAGFLYYMETSGPWQPYFAFGAGRLTRETEQPDKTSEDFSDNEANIGLGIRYFMTDNLSLRGDTRYHYGIDDEAHDLSFSLGLAVHFGEVEPWPSPRRDTDGDGVPDDRDDCPNTPRGTRVDSRGCPIAVDRVASIRLLVHFDFDRSTVKPQYFSDIRSLADYLKRNRNIYVELEGHTDSIGSNQYNNRLSQRRADAVMRVLVNEYGIASRRVIARGYGETRPVADNRSDRGRAENRRVIATLEVQYDNNGRR